MSLKSINTTRLILVPITLEIIRDLLKNSTSELKKLGLKTGENWPTNDTKDILPIICKEFEKYIVPTGFEIWMIVNRDNMQVIGDIGFKGQPNNEGEVEIGYGLITEEQGKGYGYEALEAMVKWAFYQDKVKVVKADCLIDNYPSIRILQKVGMKEVSSDKELIYWELHNNQE
jgi:ribosomal-protein-alanine N-acetyltransferase